MGYVTITENSILYERRNELARITAFGEDVLRFQSSPNGVLEEEDWILLPQPETVVHTEKREHSAVITNGRIRAELFDNGKVVYSRQTADRGEYEVMLEEMTEYAFDSFYRTYRAKGSTTHRANVLFKPDEKEHFYGLGGEHNGCFDMKGTVSELQHRNTKTSVPFVYSSKKYGFLWNNPSIGQCELTKNHSR